MPSTQAWLVAIILDRADVGHLHCRKSYWTVLEVLMTPVFSRHLSCELWTKLSTQHLPLELQEASQNLHVKNTILDLPLTSNPFPAFS